MKLPVLFCCIFLSGIGFAQTPCTNVKLIDQTIITTEYPLLHKLRPVDSSSLKKEVLQQMKVEITKETSPDFYNKLKIKNLKKYDSAVIKNTWNRQPVYNAEGDEVDFLYVVIYEVQLNRNIPFLFRVDFTRDGHLLKKGQLKTFASDKPYINCTTAINIATADKNDPIKAAAEVYLFLHTGSNEVVWQIVGAQDKEKDYQPAKVINARTKEITERGQIRRISNLERIEDVKSAE